MYIRLQAKDCYSCQILIKNAFSRKISKHIQTSNFMKIHLVRAEFFHADRPTDQTNLTVALRNLAKAPSRSQIHIIPCHKTAHAIFLKSVIR
jgi:hypothetical protein